MRVRDKIKLGRLQWSEDNQYVSEAKARGLSCGVAGASKTQTVDKNKGIVTSEELEKAEQKNGN